MEDTTTHGGTSRLIADLAARADPVSPLWPPARRLAAWLAAGLGTLALFSASHLRPDLASQLGKLGYLLELAGSILAASAVAHLACVAAVPGRHAGRLPALLAATGGALVLALAVLHPTRPSEPLGGFLAVGLPCLFHTAFTALPPAGLLFVLVRRGAALAPVRAGALAGVAALHISLWHLGPGVFAGLATGALGARWLRRWPGRRP